MGDSSSIHWTDHDKGWLEGVIDSEGSLSLVTENRPNSPATVTFKPKLTIANTDIRFMHEVERLTGKYPIKRLTEHKPLFTTELYSNALRWILPRIQLIIKERQRLLLLEALPLLQKRNTLNRQFNRMKASPDRTWLLDSENRLKEIVSEVRRLNEKWNGVNLIHG